VLLGGGFNGDAVLRPHALRREESHYYNNDRFIFPKGMPRRCFTPPGRKPVCSNSELLKLRQFNCNLEGHPTPRLPFVDVATGSLGQGLSVGAGMALAARLRPSELQYLRLLGDGEIAEGAVWEAMSFAGIYKLNNLIAIVDNNRLGQKPGDGRLATMSAFIGNA